MEENHQPKPTQEGGDIHARHWIPKRTGVGEVNYPLEDAIHVKKVEGIKRYLEDNEFDTTQTVIVEHTISRGLKQRIAKKQGREIDDINFDELAGKKKDLDRTVSEYLMNLKHIGNFAARVADYRTALICDRKKCPFNPHPVDPVTVIM